MKLFSNTRIKRHHVFMVLLVWLFALASGIANACLLEVRETHSHVVAAGSVEAARASLILPGHAGAVADGVDVSQFSAPCLKVCDDGSRSVPKHDLTVAQADPGPAPRVVVLWTADSPLAAALGQRDDLLLSTQSLPLRVRYARLAL